MHLKISVETRPEGGFKGQKAGVQRVRQHVKGNLNPEEDLLSGLGARVCCSCGLNHRLGREDAGKGAFRPYFYLTINAPENTDRTIARKRPK